MHKIRVGVVYGGVSDEHEVSHLSAKNVIEAIPLGRFDVVPILISREGKWYLPKEEREISISTLSELIDVAFPILHGPNGEDGSLQGLFSMIGIPYVGAKILSSAICMDKEVAKRLLAHAGLPIPRYKALRKSDAVDLEAIFIDLGLPLFVKPANYGSSIGISKVEKREELPNAIEYAYRYDEKILIEEAIRGREIECGVIGEEDLRVSLPCEIIPAEAFHTYGSKYQGETGSQTLIPAPLSKELTEKCQKRSFEAYRALECCGLARVDLFLSPEGEVFVNEVNTLPGCTDLSPFPKMFTMSGLSFSHVVEYLIDLALKTPRAHHPHHELFPNRGMHALKS